MSSSSKTANLNLNQWAASDGVCRADFNTDNAIIDASLGAVPLRKLKEVTTSAAASSVEVDLSDIDMSGYSELWMDLRLGVSWSATNTAYMRLNNISDSSYNDSYPYSNHPLCVQSTQMRFYIGTHRFILGTPIVCMKPAFGFYGDIAASALTPANWTSITFYVSTGTIPAGGTVKIFGVENL